MSATRGIAWWAAAVAVSLRVMSYLHLHGLLGSTGRPPFDPSAAGVAEALIGAVLFAAAVVALLAPGSARPVLLGATGFAVAGFAVGITVTIGGGDPIDIAYHATVLPILVVLLLAAVRARRGTPVASAR